MMHTEEERAAAIADYLETGDTIAHVAARHKVARSTLGTWVAGLRSEVALTGGRWVPNGRGVQVWQPFVKETVRAMSDQERRVMWEEWMFTEDEARDMHARHAGGCREPRTVVGERVYQRRQKRAQRARREAA